jgi:hypothetical protein
VLYALLLLLLLLLQNEGRGLFSIRKYQKKKTSGRGGEMASKKSGPVL